MYVRVYRARTRKRTWVAHRFTWVARRYNPPPNAKEPPEGALCANAGRLLDDAEGVDVNRQNPSRVTFALLPAFEGGVCADIQDPSLSGGSGCP